MPPIDYSNYHVLYVKKEHIAKRLNMDISLISREIIREWALVVLALWEDRYLEPNERMVRGVELSAEHDDLPLDYVCTAGSFSGAAQNAENLTPDDSAIIQIRFE